MKKIDLLLCSIFLFGAGCTQDAQRYFDKGEEDYNVEDYTQAVDWYRRAAECGDVQAQCNLGVCYKYGAGVPQDFAQAVNWFRKAAEHGDVQAQRNLGIFS